MTHRHVFHARRGLVITRAKKDIKQKAIASRDQNRRKNLTKLHTIHCDNYRAVKFCHKRF